MEIRRLDVSKILILNEKVECKTERKNSKLAFIPMAICYLFFLICLTGDCFFIGALIPMREVMKEKAVNNFLLPLAITLAVLHVVPFIFWFVFTLQNKAKNEGKWYLLTNRRVCIINSAKTLSVNSVFFEQITAMKVAKSTVYLTVGEDKIVLDGLESPSFGERLERLLTGDSEEEYSPVFAQPQEPTKVEEDNQPLTQPEKQEGFNPNEQGDKNLTEQIDQVLQEFADKVLNEGDDKNADDNKTENN